MELFDSLNLYLLNHPILLDQLEHAYRIKFWLFLALAIYFMLLPYRQQQQEIKEEKNDDSKNPRAFCCLSRFS